MPREEAPRIRIEEHGPYRLSSGVRLVRTASIETEHGEPVAWGADEPIETEGGDVALCRCGGSSAKPFCDESCDRIGFDGTLVAEPGPDPGRRKTFVGVRVVMTDDRSLCQHAGFCSDRSTSVWGMIRETQDPEVRERLIGMVRRCPSGALAYAPAEGDPPTEPELPVGVAVIRDGPLWARGGITITAPDGRDYEVRNRVTLCRCGHSRNKPFCDGSHFDVGFREP